MDDTFVEIGGAKSSDFAPRYDQIPASSLRRIALRFTQGNKKYDGPEAAYLGGEMNWQKGDGTFFRERFNHVMEHLNRWKASWDRSTVCTREYDDDLAAAAWGLIILMWAEENNRLEPRMSIEDWANELQKESDKMHAAQDAIEADRTTAYQKFVSYITGK